MRAHVLSAGAVTQGEGGAPCELNYKCDQSHHFSHFNTRLMTINTTIVGHHRRHHRRHFHHHHHHCHSHCFVLQKST